MTAPTVLDQIRLADAAVRRLQKRGVVVTHTECGRLSKPVINVAHNAAARELRDVESHIICQYGPEAMNIMVTDYYGCQVTWIEPRTMRHV